MARSTAFSLSDEQYRRIDRIAERVMVLFLGVVIVWFLSECARTVAVSGWSFLISGVRGDPQSLLQFCHKEHALSEAWRELWYTPDGVLHIQPIDPVRHNAVSEFYVCGRRASPSLSTAICTREISTHHHQSIRPDGYPGPTSRLTKGAT